MKNNFPTDIEPTADGSPTLYRRDIDEHYHSVKGALAESLHVYINTGWKEASKRLDSIRVFEVGFGTGLNAALTAKASLETKTATEYYAVELYPLSEDLIARLLDTQTSDLSPYFKAVNAAAWNQEIELNPCFKLTRTIDNFLTMDLPGNIDVVYFDAFAPEKQSEMWSEEIFEKIFRAMSPGGILTTYCAKGSIRRLLQNTGFTVERLPGPPSGKREILRATKHAGRLYQATHLMPSHTISRPRATDGTM